MIDYACFNFFDQEKVRENHHFIHFTIKKCVGIRLYSALELREKCPNTDQKYFRIWTLFTQCREETLTLI